MFAIAGLMMWTILILGVGAFALFGIRLAVRAIGALESRSAGQGEIGALRTRLELMESLVESQATELDRLRAAQDFTTRLLETRSKDSGSAP